MTPTSPAPSRRAPLRHEDDPPEPTSWVSGTYALMGFAPVSVLRLGCLALLLGSTAHAQPSPPALPPSAAPSLYHDGWIDLNKNGRMDPYEDSALDVEARVADLLAQMTLEEKTAQMATLYGYGRVLRDELPVEAWRDSLWADGIANIDEHLNGVVVPFNGAEYPSSYSYPHSRRAEAGNEVQRWFVEETRLGIPADFSNEGLHGLTHDRATLFPAPLALGATWNRPLIREMGHVIGREARALGYTNVYAPILDLAQDPRWGRVVETYGEDPFLVAELGEALVRGIQAEGVASTVKHFAAYSVPKGGRDGEARTDPHVAPRELHALHLFPFRRVIERARPMGVMSSYNDWDGVPVTGSAYFLTELLRQQYGFDGYIVSDSDAVEYLFTKHGVAPTYADAVRQVVEAGLNVRTTFSPPGVFVRPLRDLVRSGAVSHDVLDARVADVLRVKFRLGLFDRPYVADPAAADRTVATPEHRAVALRASREALVLLKNDTLAATGGPLLPLDPARLGRVAVVGPLSAAEAHSLSRYGPSNVDVVSILEGLRARLPDAEVVHVEGVGVVDARWPESEVLPEPPAPDEQAGIEEAARLAAGADVAVVVLGGNERTVGEGLSRTSLDLPGHQEALLRAVHATGTPVVLVLVTGRPLAVNWAARHVPAVVAAWFPGLEGGRAVAEALLGDFNPGGKSPVTWVRTVGQLPWTFPSKPGAQASQPPWMVEQGGASRVDGVLFPFGHGLSYTRFAYSGLRVTPERGGPGTTFAVEFEVENVGGRAGEEVAQVYVRDPVSSVTVYERQLRGFERVRLEPGERATVRVELGPDDLALYDRHMDYVVEPGQFEVLVGSSSADVRLRRPFEVAAPLPGGL